MRENCTFRLSGGRRGALQWAPPPTRQRGSRVTPVEGRDLSSRQTQYVGKDLEIGKPINSDKWSETAEGVARKSVSSCPREAMGRAAEVVAPSSSIRTDGGCPVAQVNDLSRSLTAFDPISTLVVVVEMSKASWLVSGAVPD